MHRFSTLQKGEPNFLLIKHRLHVVISFQRIQYSMERVGDSSVEKPEKSQPGDQVNINNDEVFDSIQP